MRKLGFFGAALALSFALIGPATAKYAGRHAIADPDRRAQNAACDPRDPGNPYSRKYEFAEWTSFRARGGWDARNDYTCQPIPPYWRGRE
jgi:hypothetical protein